MTNILFDRKKAKTIRAVELFSDDLGTLRVHFELAGADGVARRRILPAHSIGPIALKADRIADRLQDHAKTWFVQMRKNHEFEYTNNRIEQAIKVRALMNEILTILPG